LAAQLSKLENAQHSLSEHELRAQLKRLVKPVAEARDAGTRVRDIVRDLNVFSRPEDEAQGPVDLVRVLESAVRLAWNELRQRARLVRDWGELPSVRGSEARLGQVLLNLLINAAQAIEEGSPETHEIRVTARVLSTTHVLVEVCDTGSGIPPDSIGRIFDPFFTTKPPGIGTGLGLSICQRLLANMGGQIEVDSRLGQGTTFRITLLRADPDPQLAAAVASLPPSTQTAARGCLMVIDDDPQMASALEQMLTPEHVVHVFMSARTALAHLQTGANVDVVLCDVMMPDMSGIEFHTALKQSHPELASRVVFVTGGTLNAKARAFLDRVDNARLYKPFDAATLHALVNQQLLSCSVEN
jgi:CheY-like chemotaxis protein